MRRTRLLAPASLLAAALAAFLLLAAPSPQHARAQVLQHVPSDALVVVKVNDLKPVSDKISAFATKLGLAQVQPAFADPLETLKQQMGITQGLNEKGDAAFVLLNGPMQERQPPALILLPVSDYQAFLKNFPDAKTEGEISTVQIKEDDDETFVTQRGDYAVLAPKREYLTTMEAKGLTPEGIAAKQLEEKDIVAFVNMKSARTRILPELQKRRAEILANFEKGFREGAQIPDEPGEQEAEQDEQPKPADAADADADADAAGAAEREKFIPLARAVVNRALDVAEQAINDADAITYGWTFGEEGLRATGVVEFAKESPSGQRVAKLQNSDKTFLSGLPKTNYWLFGGTSGENGEVMDQMINDFLAPIEKEFAALGEQGQAIEEYLAAMRKYFSNLQGQSFGWVAPQGMIGQEAVIQMISVQRGDASALMAAAKEMFQSQEALMGAFGGPAAAAQQEVKTEYLEKAKTVDGVTFDQLQTEFVPQAGGPRTPQQMQAQQMMAWMYGPGGMDVYLAKLGEDKIVTAQGVSDATLKEFVQAAQAGKDVLGTLPSLQATQKHLPDQRMAAWYISLDQFATSLANYAKAFGMPINFQVPPDLPPLGGTLSSEGSAIVVNGYAPTQTLQSVIAAIMQTYMQMQGGQQPGGPGGL